MCIRDSFKINPLYRDLSPGVHEVRERDANGVMQVYKVAVRRGVGLQGKPCLLYTSRCV